MYIDKEKKNVILILLIISVFAGAVIEISEGSPIIGIFLLLLSAFIMAKMDLHKGTSSAFENSKLCLIIGILIIFADIGYNLRMSNEFGTLDIMVLFFGISLVGTYSHDLNMNRFSSFGIYLSSTFILLFLIFYPLFDYFGIDFLHKFDHYFILLPTVKLLGLFGIPLEVIATETVYLQGAEKMTIIIGGPCSGLYSMFLLIGIVFGYSKVEKIAANKILTILGLSILIAYISNLFRVVILYLTAYMYGQKTMLIVHAHLGWIIFALVAAFIMYLVNLRK